MRAIADRFYKRKYFRKLDDAWVKNDFGFVVGVVYARLVDSGLES